MNNKNKITHDINTRSKAKKNNKAHLIVKPHSLNEVSVFLKDQFCLKSMSYMLKHQAVQRLQKNMLLVQPGRGSLLKMKRNTATASRDKHHTTDSFPIGETHHLRTMLDNYGATYASSSAVEGIKEKTQPGTEKFL